MMNRSDQNELTDRWHIDTRHLGNKVDEAFKDAQVHAYALGLARGMEELKDLANQLCAARDSENQRDLQAVIAAIYKIGDQAGEQ